MSGTKSAAKEKAAYDAGVAAERARCLKIAGAQEDNSYKANHPYDNGSGSLGYESACRDIAEAIAKATGATP